MHKQNLHTHTTYCDGFHTPEALLAAAVEKGFDSLGFSGHSYMHFAPNYSMSMIGTNDYIAHINKLKKESPIPIYLGLEFDRYSPVDFAPYDYIIGSVHNLIVNGEYVTFDRNAIVVKELLATYFQGDGLALAKAYYQTLATLPACGKIDIIGHFDIICKHAEHTCFFDRECKAYKGFVLEAVDALAGKIPFFEVNTGAMARGLRTTPYPDTFAVKALRQAGFGAVISSDCHDAAKLDFGFADAKKLLAACGFTEYYVRMESGFTAVPLLI